MTDIEAIILKAIGENRRTRSGWNFSSCLIWPPKKQSFFNDDGNEWELWLILQEDRLPNGYQIAFDPEDQEFALACQNRIVGWHADFEAAVNGM